MTRVDRIRRWFAGLLRRVSISLDRAHLVVIEANANGTTMANYLAALAQKREFTCWTEDYNRRVQAKSKGRHIRAASVSATGKK